MYELFLKMANQWLHTHTNACTQTHTYTALLSARQAQGVSCYGLFYNKEEETKDIKAWKRVVT